MQRPLDESITLYQDKDNDKLIAEEEICVQQGRFYKSI